MKSKSIDYVCPERDTDEHSEKCIVFPEVCVCKNNLWSVEYHSRVHGGTYILTCNNCKQKVRISA